MKIGLFGLRQAYHVMHRDRALEYRFRAEASRRTYLEELFASCAELDLELYAYCLMSNHAHLIVALPAISDSLHKLNQRLAIVAGHTTRLVPNRFRAPVSTPERIRTKRIDSSTYMSACLLYVELNPVDFKRITHPEQYPWSSYRARMGLRQGDVLDSAPCYQALGATDEVRRLRYRELVEEKLRARRIASAGTTLW